MMWLIHGCNSSWESIRVLRHIKMWYFEIMRLYEVRCNLDVLLLAICDELHGSVTLYCAIASTRLLLLRSLNIVIVIVLSKTHMYVLGWYDSAYVGFYFWSHSYGGLSLDERGKHWITDQGMLRCFSSISFEAKQASSWILYCSCYIWCDWFTGAIAHENQYAFCDISRCDTLK